MTQKPSPDTVSDNSLELCATFDTDWQAHLAAGVLAEHNIPSSIDNEIFASIYPIGFNTLGGIRLMVFKSDLEQAKQLLADFSPSTPTDNGEDSVH